jgi:SAM-dependent methyltransferase
VSAINSEIKREETADGGKKDKVRILDVGCGRGHFLAYASNVLPILHPEIGFEFYGYDVREHGARCPDYLANLVDYLSSETPSVSWAERIAVISSADSLPYDDGFFHYTTSNQVFEHVRNHELVLSELHRCLGANGVSINLFPMKEVLYEGHVHLPLAHRISNPSLLKRYIKAASSTGRGRVCEYKPDAMSTECYAEFRTEYMLNCTNYRFAREFLSLSSRYGFRISFRYTAEFFQSKLRSLLRVAPNYEYRTNRSALLDRLAFLLLKYVSSVTLVLEKQ